MTPERQKWWNSLPKEEKLVREDIDEFKRMIKHNKKHLIPYVAFAKYCIRYSKKAIKAMRKQIAMRPVDNNGIVKCPVCREILYDKEFLIIKTLCCPDCGQKLR